MIDLETCIRALNTNKVRFVLIGGAAMTVQGSAYVTNDIDIAYSNDRPNLEHLVEALAPFQPKLRMASQEAVPFKFDVRPLAAGSNFTLDTSIGAIDLLGYVSGFSGYAAVEAMSEERSLFDGVVKVLSVEGLIKAKRAAGRQKDMLAIPELEALLEADQSGASADKGKGA